MSAAKSQEEVIAELERAVGYYKKRLDELSGENIKGEYRISGLRKEIKQKRSAFALLSKLQLSFGKITTVDDIFVATADAISQTLDMDRIVILTPFNTEGLYTPTVWRGSENLTEEQFNNFKNINVEFPREFSTDPSQFVLVNKETVLTDMTKKISEALHLPFYCCTPIIAEGRSIGVILMGRLKEAGTALPPLDNGDVETLASISGLLSAIIQNMRVGVLQEMDRLKTEFFANLSHEFRTPITLTLGAVDGIMNGRFGQIDNPAIITQAELIKGNQSRLLNLINQILDLEKLESGKVTLKVQPVRNINAFFQKRLEQFSALTEKKGVKLVYKGEPKLEALKIYLDPERFDRMVFNLLSNAVKFTKTGSITLEAFATDKEYGFRVIDTGMGIKASQIGHIFDRFRQADGSASREHAGTGIGLSLVKQIAELHFGTVNVRSEYGKGTTFEIIAPQGSSHFSQNDVIEEAYTETDAASGHLSQVVVDVKEGKVSDEEKAKIEEWNENVVKNARPGVGRMLYCDDNSDLRHYLRDLMKEEVDILLAYDGKDGLEKAQRYKPDVVVSDLMMPVMTGEEFLGAMKASPELKDIPFVLLTARSGMESKLANLAAGADDYLNKPFSEAELRARVRNLITIRRQALQIKAELIAARGIQQALLPDLSQVPSKCFAPMAVDVLYKPCDILSGDFYDIVVKDDHAYFYVADVTSHGTASAQVTYVIKSLVTSHVERSVGPVNAAKMLEDVHRKYERLNLEYAVAMMLVHLNLQTGETEIVCSGAPPALLKTGTAVAVKAAPPGPYMFAANKFAEPQDIRYETLKLDVPVGSELFVITDGCFEFVNKANGQDYGLRRLTKTMGTLPSQDWQKPLLDELTKANGGDAFADDITVFRISRL